MAYFKLLCHLYGFFIGSTFADLIAKFDHWIAFLLLFLIGANMIKESFEKNKKEIKNDFDFKTMLPLAIATSIDALMVGVTFALLNYNIYYSVLVIGLTTFGISFLGVFLGNLFEKKFEKRAKIVGGIMLILIGLKILVEHIR